MAKEIQKRDPAHEGWIQRILAAYRKWPAAVRKSLCVVTCIALVLLIAPPLQVTYVAFRNPTTTGPILARWFESKCFSLNLQPAELTWRNIEDVPPFFTKCVWQMEDSLFFKHHGFDWDQIKMARRVAARTGQPARGASTITQQCARSLFLWQKRSWFRKGLEAYYTIWMELLLSKKRILELYVNVIELGDGLYGIETAAQYYCGKDADQLNKRECAILSAILPRPLKWNPTRPDAEILRRRSRAMQRALLVELPAEFSKEN